MLPFSCWELVYKSAKSDIQWQLGPFTLTDSKTYEVLNQWCKYQYQSTFICGFPYVCKSKYLAPVYICNMYIFAIIYCIHISISSYPSASSILITSSWLTHCPSTVQGEPNRFDWIFDLRMNKHCFTLSNFPNIPTFQRADLLPSVGVINQNASICGRPQPQASIGREAHTHQLPHVGGKFHFRILPWHSSSRFPKNGIGKEMQSRSYEKGQGFQFRTRLVLIKCAHPLRPVAECRTSEASDRWNRRWKRHLSRQWRFSLPWPLAHWSRAIPCQFAWILTILHKYLNHLSTTPNHLHNGKV